MGILFGKNEFYMFNKYEGMLSSKITNLNEPNSAK